MSQTWWLQYRIPVLYQFTYPINCAAIILGWGYDHPAGEARKAKSWKASSNLRVPEKKILAAADPCLLFSRVTAARTSSQPAKGIPESAVKVRQYKRAMKDRELYETGRQFELLLTSEPWMTKSCPLLLSVHLCYLQRELHRRYPSLHFAFACDWWVHWTEAQGFPQAHDSTLLPPKCSETQFLQGAREAKGGVRKTSYVCGVFPCCWKVSKDISGADETFQHIHLESAVSFPSCIIYRTIPSCLKNCCKLFSESPFSLCAVSCNNLSKIYFGSSVLQQRVVLFVSPTVLLQT